MDSQAPNAAVKEWLLGGGLGNIENLKPESTFGNSRFDFSFIKDGKPFIACGENSALLIKEICPDGSKKMDSLAFVDGRFIAEGEILK